MITSSLCFYRRVDEPLPGELLPPLEGWRVLAPSSTIAQLTNTEHAHTQNTSEAEFAALDAPRRRSYT